MPDSPYMQKSTGRGLVLLLISMLIIQLGIICYVFYAGYQGRKALVTSQQVGCERGKKDRAANARGWRQAQKARKADGDYAVARTYGNIALGLEKRSVIVCKDVFPNAKVFQ